MSSAAVASASVVHPVAPVTGWRRLARDVAAVGGSTTVCHVLGAATSLLLRAALSPSQMGVWQGLKLLLGYANYANLGASKGAARELAVALGQGDAERARQSLHLAFTFNTLTSLLYAAGLLSAIWWLPLIRPDSAAGSWTLGLAALAAMVVLQRHLTFQVTILRCRQAFATTARLAMIEGVLTLTVAGTAAWLWQLPGLYAGTLLAFVAALGYLRYEGVERLRPRWHWAEIRRLIAIGAPILFGGVVAGLFQSLDKLCILAFSTRPDFDLGCYSGALLITAQIYGLANMLAIVLAPRYAELFGRAGCRAAVAAFTARSSELVAAVSALAGGLGLVAAAPALAWLFPRYEPGWAVAVWLVPGIVALALALPLNHYLVAVGHERRAATTLAVGAGLAAIGNVAALRGGMGLAGVAAATSLAYGVYYLLTLFLSIWPRLDFYQRRRYAIAHAAICGTTLGPAIVIALHPSLGASRSGLCLSTFFCASAVAGLWGLVLAAGWHRGGWRSAWRAEDAR